MPVHACCTTQPRRTLFLWEALLTFFFLTIVYAALFVRPGHGDLSPLAIGLALFAALSTGEHGPCHSRCCPPSSRLPALHAQAEQLSMGGHGRASCGFILQLRVLVGGVLSWLFFTS